MTNIQKQKHRFAKKQGTLADLPIEEEFFEALGYAALLAKKEERE